MRKITAIAVAVGFVATSSLPAFAAANISDTVSRLAQPAAKKKTDAAAQFAEKKVKKNAKPKDYRKPENNDRS